MKVITHRGKRLGRHIGKHSRLQGPFQRRPPHRHCRPLPRRSARDAAEAVGQGGELAQYRDLAEQDLANAVDGEAYHLAE